MKIPTKLFPFMIAALLGGFAVSCDDDDNFERAGEKVDETIDEIGDDTEEALDDLEDEVDDTFDDGQ